MFLLRTQVDPVAFLRERQRVQTTGQGPKSLMPHVSAAILGCSVTRERPRLSTLQANSDGAEMRYDVTLQDKQTEA